MLLSDGGGFRGDQCRECVVYLLCMGDGGGGARPGDGQSGCHAGPGQGLSMTESHADRRKEIAGEGIAGRRAVHGFHGEDGLTEETLLTGTERAIVTQGKNDLHTRPAAAQNLANVLRLLLTGESGALDLIENEPGDGN